MSRDLVMERAAGEIPEVETLPVPRSSGLASMIGSISPANHKVFVVSPAEKYWLIRYSYANRMVLIKHWQIRNIVLDYHPADWIRERLKLDKSDEDNTFVLDFAMEISKKQYEALKDLL